MEKTKKYFRLAKLVSKTSTYPRRHIGAAIFKRRKLVAFGANRLRTHTRQKKYVPYRFPGEPGIQTDIGRVHAEMAALIKAKRFDLTGAAIYVYREDLNNNLADCKPCGACMQAIIEAGIIDVHYTSTQGFHHLKVNNV